MFKVSLVEEMKGQYPPFDSIWALSEYISEIKEHHVWKDQFRIPLNNTKCSIKKQIKAPFEFTSAVQCVEHETVFCGGCVGNRVAAIFELF
jgi:hypothetical protein